MRSWWEMFADGFLIEEGRRWNRKLRYVCVWAQGGSNLKASVAMFQCGWKLDFLARQGLQMVGRRAVGLAGQGQWADDRGYGRINDMGEKSTSGRHLDMLLFALLLHEDTWPFRT